MRAVQDNADEDELEDGEGALGLGDAAAIVLRHVRLIVALTLLLGIAASGFSLLLTNRYEAVATVQVDPRHKKIVDIDGVLSDLRTDNATMSSEVEIIKARSTLLRVIEHLKLREDPEFSQPPLLHTLMQRLGLAQAAGKLAQTVSALAASKIDAATGRDDGRGVNLLWPDWIGNGLDVADPTRDAIAISIGSRLNVRRVSNSQLIEIRFTSSDPVKAARIANQIAATYIRSQIEAKDKASEHANAMLDNKLVGLRDKVAETERGVERFKIENNLFDPDGRPLDASQLKREMEAAQTARAQAEEAHAKYEQARRMMLAGTGRDSLADVLESQTIRKLREEYFKTARKEAELSAKYGPRHPEMEKVHAEIARAQAELSGEITKIIQSLKSTWQLAQEKAGRQEAQLESLRQRIEATKDKQWRLREMESEAAASRQIYEAMLKRARQTEQTIGLQLPDARLVSPADVPLGRAGPKRKLIALAGFGAGLALGIALAFLLELGAGGLLRSEDVERRLKVAHLASLPQIPASRRQTDRMPALRQMIAEPRGEFAESMRALRHELDSRHAAGPGRVILVTSAQAGEGKTLVTSNLALHYALMGRRALLIDADLRQRRLSGDLGADGRPGLLDLLAGRSNPNEAILQDRSTGLHLLPASSGERGLNSALTRENMAALLAALRPHYDVIVLDTTPLLPVADTRLMAHCADQVVMVANWRSTPAKLVRRAIKCLGVSARKLNGVALNRMDVAMHSSQFGTYPTMRGPLAAPTRTATLARAA